MEDTSSGSNAGGGGNSGAPGIGPREKWLFWACFIALITTAFGFIVRTMVIDDWGLEFGLNESQKGEIFGVGLWPFAVSIVLFSLVVDRIGYGWAMVFAFLCHVASGILTICATGYWTLYVATFIVALGNGTVEAVINPVVATMFSREKTKWLNILHAGWPGGLVLGGVFAIFMGNLSWQWKVGLIFLPTVVYGLMMIGRSFPVHERVEAGVSHKAMLQEVGVLGTFLVSALIVREVCTRLATVFMELGSTGAADVFNAWWLQLGIVAAIVIVYGIYVEWSLGRPMFIFLLLIMIPLATTELGTDSWMTPIMTPAMERINLNPGWVLVYTSFIMMVLRFFAGPIVHKLSPLGLLAVSALIAASGLAFLSKATGVAILAAATLYGFGKTFFWPTMLGVVAERFPRGGALTLNATGGMGMLSVGIVGAFFLGNIQDKDIDHNLEANHPALHARVVGEEHLSVFGKYQAVDTEKEKSITPAEAAIIAQAREDAKKNALWTVALFPCIMFVCYLILIVYFKSRGGYRAIDISEEHG